MGGQEGKIRLGRDLKVGAAVLDVPVTIPTQFYGLKQSA
jgi:hypothetical protein